MDEIGSVKKHLHDLFKIKDLGDLNFFLGLEIARSKRGIAVCQRKYCIDLLKEYGLMDAKAATTPMDYTIKLAKDSGSLLNSASEYRRLVGRLAI